MEDLRKEMRGEKQLAQSVITQVSLLFLNETLCLKVFTLCMAELQVPSHGSGHTVKIMCLFDQGGS